MTEAKDNPQSVMTFTCIGDNNQSVWGSKVDRELSDETETSSETETPAETPQSIQTPQATVKNGEYEAYLCFASARYNGVYVNHNDQNHSLGVYNGSTKESISDITIKNAKFKKGKFKITVSVSGKGLETFSSDNGWNSIYVDTTLPGSERDKLSVSKVVLKMDGKEVVTIKNPALTPDSGKTDDFTQIMLLNTWNNYSQQKCKSQSIQTTPKKK